MLIFSTIVTENLSIIPTKLKINVFFDSLTNRIYPTLAEQDIMSDGDIGIAWKSPAKQ